MLLPMNEGGSHQPHMAPFFHDPVASLSASVQAGSQPAGGSQRHHKRPLSNNRLGTEIAREQAQTGETLSRARRDRLTVGEKRSKQRAASAIRPRYSVVRKEAPDV